MIKLGLFLFNTNEHELCKLFANSTADVVRKQTAGYRKISSRVATGLLLPSETTFSPSECHFEKHLFTGRQAIAIRAP